MAGYDHEEAMQRASVIGAAKGLASNTATLRKQTVLEEMANRVSDMLIRVQTINSRLSENADRLFGGCPECGDEAYLADRPNGSLSELDRTMRGLSAQIEILANTSSRFNEI